MRIQRKKKQRFIIKIRKLWHSFQKKYSYSYIVEQKASVLFLGCIFFLPIQLGFVILNFKELPNPTYRELFIQYINSAGLLVLFLTLFLLWRGKYNLGTFIITTFWSLFACIFYLLNYELFVKTSLNPGIYLFFGVLPMSMLFQSNRYLLGMIILFLSCIGGAYWMTRFDPNSISVYKHQYINLINIFTALITEGTILFLIFRIVSRSYSKIEAELKKNKKLAENLEIRVNERTSDLKLANEKLENIGNHLMRYLPPQLVNSIIEGKSHPVQESQRKKLTIFFSDIRGFTETTDTLESEELTRLLNEYLTEMTGIAHKWGGTVDKFIGDAIMIFFGAPQATNDKDHALRCVRMAIEMQEKMKILQTKWFNEGIENPLSIRIGINTGVATVGNFGTNDRLSYTAIGGQVNLASRLEGICTPGKILIGHPTWALVNQEIQCQPKEKVKVKGLSREIMTYEVES